MGPWIVIGTVMIWVFIIVMFCRMEIGVLGRLCMIRGSPRGVWMLALRLDTGIVESRTRLVFPGTSRTIAIRILGTFDRKVKRTFFECVQSASFCRNRGDRHRDRGSGIIIGSRFLFQACRRSFLLTIEVVPKDYLVRLSRVFDFRFLITRLDIPERQVMSLRRITAGVGNLARRFYNFKGDAVRRRVDHESRVFLV